MNARDLLQLNDQLIAFNALIKGDLAKEVAQAKAALEALGSAQDIAGAQTRLETDKNAFEAYKTSVQTILDETKIGIQNEQENVKKAFADLQTERENVSKAKADYVTAQDKFLNDTDVTNKTIADAYSALALATAKVTADQESLAKAVADVSAREAEVVRKLAAMKAIV